ncbi:EF-hand domain-containing protein D2-like [Anneissia japonica]|uniref:EF-hand domain-containing protein D2-like n=1 Tax=Anneissia japonica TaxID=1529436 RepID=UPI0014256F7E|nr:EF-hand domain-containing protein D2-like [Anneissia japonica]
MVDNELASRLQKRLDVEAGKETEQIKLDYKDPHEEFAHPYPEFSEFSREQCKMFEDMFAQYNANHDDYICYNELKTMMELRGEPLTHLELKKLIAAVDEDGDGKLCFREFMLMWKKCLTGVLPEGTGYAKIVATNKIILSKPPTPASTSGLSGAKALFETKQRSHADSENNAEEIREEQRKAYAKKRADKAAAEKEEARKAAFAARAGAFGN